MTDKTAYFEKPYRYNHKIDDKIIIDVFNIVGNLNINDLKIKMLLEQIPYNIVDANGNSLYHKVLMDDDVLKTENQRLQMIKFLFNENCNPDTPNNMNVTPFHLACMKQYESIIDFFIDINVDINYKDSYGNTPLHKLLVGNIKLEEKLNIGKLFPVPPKTQDYYKYDSIKKLKEIIWEDIKDSKFIKSIDETIKFNIEQLDNTNDIETLKLYINKLVFNNLDMTKYDKVSKLTEITNIGVNKFKTNIEKEWGNFANITDIELHKTTPTSYPKNDVSGVSIIKTRNYKKYLFNKINLSIDDLIKSLNEELEYDDIDINYIYDKSLNNFIDDNKELITNKCVDGSGNIIFKSECITDDLDYKYIDYNKLFDTGMQYDYADNIIDLDNKIFIGGARQIEIINDFSFNNKIFNRSNEYYDFIPTLLYTLVLPFNKALAFTNNFNSYYKDNKIIFNLYNENTTPVEINILYNNIIEFIYKLINNLDIMDIKDKIYNNIKRNGLKNFIKIYNLLEENINLNTLDYHNKIKYIYYFMNLFLSCKGKEEGNTDNLKIEMNICCILLIAGMINNKTDNLGYSIEQCFKPLLLKSIYIENDKYGFIKHTDIFNTYDDYHRNYPILICYIYALFSNENIDNIYDNIINTNIIPDDINNIDTILETVIENLDDINKHLKDILLEVIKLFKKQSTPKTLSNMIVDYYNNLNQTPQALHVADLIAIIRDYDEKEMYKLFKKLTNLLIPTYKQQKFDGEDRIVIEDIYDLNIEDDFKNIINDDDYAFKMKIINEFALPSRINYYIYLEDNYYDDFCSYKFIESYYLGLNFMGVIPEININGDPVVVDIKGTQVDVNININLFNFNTNITSYNEEFINTDLLRPTNIYTLTFIFNDYFIKMGKMINKCFSVLKYIFNYFKQSNSSTKYMVSVVNLYPILLNLLNNCKIIDGYKNNIINKFNDKFENIFNITGINILDIINKFKYSKFSIKHFENIINNINGLIFMLYYVSDNDEKKMKIPKLLYYTLGSKPLVSFDNNYEPIHILNPKNEFTNKITNTGKIDFIRKENNINIYFDNIIKNNLFLYRHELNYNYIASRENKLPPAMNELFYEFYKINVIKTIIDKIDRDDEDNNFDISEEPIDSTPEYIKQKISKIRDRQTIENDILSLPINLNSTIRKIQLKLIKAKIIEELLKMYLKNRIIKYANEKYEKHFLENVKVEDINIQQLFKYNEVKYGFGTEDRFNEYKTKKFNEKLYNFFYDFSKPKDIKQQFYIYPDYYFSTNRLNNKLVVLFNSDIFKKLLKNGCDVLAHNNERISPLNMILKNYYFDSIDTIKDHIDIRTIEKDYSPFNYLFNSYKLHLETYNNFYYNQYNDIVQIIQANESFYNNIPKYLETSFKIVKYITEQYLTDNIPEPAIDKLNLDPFDFFYDYSLCPYADALNEKTIISFNIYNQIEYIKLSLNLKKNDNHLITLELIDKLKKNTDKINDKIRYLSNDMPTMFDNKYNIIKDKIDNLKNELKKYEYDDIELNVKDASSFIETINTDFSLLNIYNLELIDRYSSIIDKLNNQNLCYLDGWQQFFDKKYDDYTSLPVKLVKYQLKDLKFNNEFNKKIKLILPFYEKNNNIIRDYFEKPRYINKNEIIEFVYNLLLHLTKTVICSMIETIIKKVLFEYINQVELSPVDLIFDKVNYIFNPVMEHLYEIIPEIFVRNSVNIYTDIDDTLNKETQSVSMVLNNLLDLLKSSSPIEIDEYTINLLKNNFVMYFDTIVWKTINNWNVVIENIFMFHINQYRILECINRLLN